MNAPDIGWYTLPAILGALTVFLLGIGRITDSVLRQNRSRFIALITGSRKGRLQGFLRGAVAGSLSGSPSAVVVLLVSAADSGQVQLKRITAVLLGINLGATISGWLLALFGYQFGLAPAGILMLAAALPYAAGLGKGESAAGEMVMGLGLALLGVLLMQQYIPAGASETAWVQQFGRMADTGAGIAAAVLAGIAGAAVFRSSLGILVLAMSLAYQGWLPLYPAAALVIGAGLGLARTGFLVASRLGIPARSAAHIHLYLHLFACIWMLLGFPWIVGFTDYLMPGNAGASGDIPLRLAMLHSLQHAVNALLLLPLCSHITGLLRIGSSRRTHAAGEANAAGSKTVSVDGLRLVPAGVPEALETNLFKTQAALAGMADIAREMLMNVMNASQIAEDAETFLDQVLGKKLELTDLRSAVSQALTRSVQQPCSPAQAETIQHQQRIAHELKGVGDDCYRILLVLTRSYRKKYRFHEESDDELFGFAAQVLDFLQYNSDYLQGKLPVLDTDLAEQMEVGINAGRDILKKRARRVLEREQDAHIRGELAFIEVVGHLEHIGDCCLHISRTVRRLQKVR
ncbi:MAG: Na/Pi symporter [Spirochaeta sp.]